MSLKNCMFCNKTFKNIEVSGVVGNKAICDKCATELADIIMHAFWDLWDKKFDTLLVSESRGESKKRKEIHKEMKKENVEEHSLKDCPNPFFCYKKHKEVKKE